MNKKQIIRMVIYILLILGMLFFLCRLFKYDNSSFSRRFQTYRELPADSVDAVYIGNSAVDRYWNCAQAYEEYGMVVYPLSTDNQPGVLAKYTIEEARRYQDPDLFLIDIRGFTPDAYYFREREILLSWYTSAIPITSPVYWKSVSGFLDMMHRADPQNCSGFDLASYLSFINYHNKWSNDNFSFDELTTPASEYLGYFVYEKASTRTLGKEDVALFEAWEPPTEPSPLEPITQDVLLDLFDYINQNHLNVLFVDSPHYYKEQYAGRYLTIENLVREAGFDILVMYPEDVGLDIAKDFYNTEHVNYYGATKYTAYLGKYLSEHYSFPDHRNDADTSAFSGVMQKIEETVQRFESKK